MSKRTEVKNARRNKRRAARDANWIPAAIVDELMDVYTDGIEVAAELEDFDERITERGWEFDDELSDDRHIIWFWEPSAAEIEGDGIEPVTTIWISAADDGEYVYLLLVGCAEGHRFAPDELFDHLDVIESYRAGDPMPAFD